MSKKPKASKNKAKDVVKPPRRQPNHQEALNFIDGVVAQSPVSRQTHIAAQQALRQLGGAIAELQQLKKGK
jgi:hypothetical protein